MKYYTIQGENDSLLISENEQALTQYYDNVFELPNDYEEGKYISDDVETEVDIPDYETRKDEDGGEYQVQVSTHKETVKVRGLVLNPNFDIEQAQKERERINKLSLTKREVFLALYRDKGITPEQIKAQITTPEGLIEFEYANDYFRGNPLIGAIGASLGYTSDDLDYLFENKELPIKKLVEE